MPSLISRLDPLFHPFPAAHGLGIIASIFVVGFLVIWPETSVSGAKKDAHIPIPLLTLL